MFAFHRKKNYRKRETLTNQAEVCNWSAFQTILRRLVYIKNINYSDSMSANLNNTIQTKQHAMKKPHSYSKKKQDVQGTILVVEGF